MNKKKIHEYFKRLDAHLGQSATVIVVGASAASLMGHVRPSFDIDFEIRLNRNAAAMKKKLTSCVLQAARETGVAVNFSENIGGWSMISYLDYRKTAIPYKIFGKLNVQLIEPAYWTIGKMTRFLELDIQDMVKIIRKKKISSKKIIGVWAQAFKLSDLSLELSQFREHVLFFLKQYSQKIWGKTTKPELLIQNFLRKID